MDKFVIKKRAQKPQTVYYRVRIHKEGFEILQQLREKTGHPMSVILNAMVQFCNERLEIIESED